METRPLDAQNDAEFRRFHAIYIAAEGFKRPWASLQSLEDFLVDVTDDDPAERNIALVAVEGEEIVGAAMAYFPITDNTHVTWFCVWVEPERRRRGIGSVMLDGVMDIAREEGRTDLILETAYPFERREDHPYRRFAETHGFTLALTEVRRHLVLPVDEAFLDALITESAAHHTGYRIETFDGPLPDGLLPSLCDCRNRLGVDAPTGDLFFELERMTPEIVRHREETARKQGRTLLTTLAITGDDQVVAYNDLVVLAPPNPNVSQWGTLVLPEHRGHRLGMAVKARGLKELQHRIGPHVMRVSTSNAETNAYMVAINERLGFRPVEVTPGFLYRTTDHEAPAARTQPHRVPATLA